MVSARREGSAHRNVMKKRQKKQQQKRCARVPRITHLCERPARHTAEEIRLVLVVVHSLHKLGPFPVSPGTRP